MTIEEAATRYHWFEVDPEDGVVNLFLDHHSLATFRSCEAAFDLSILNNIKPKHRSWNLEFGIVFHKAVETFYEQKRDGNFELGDWLELVCKYWQAAKLDEQF